jgi:hypothetical protein
MRPNRDIVGRSSREILKSLLSHGVFFYTKTMEEFPHSRFYKRKATSTTDDTYKAWGEGMYKAKLRRMSLAIGKYKYADPLYLSRVGEQLEP